MAAQKHTKKIWQKFLAFLNVCYPKTHLIRALYSLDSSRSYGRLLENSKTGASRDLFLHKSDFKTSSAVNFPKIIQILDAWKRIKDMKLRLEFFFICPSTYELTIVFQPLIGTSSNYNRFWGQSFKKISWKGFKKLNSTIFWALYFPRNIIYNSLELLLVW